MVGLERAWNMIAACFVETMSSGKQYEHLVCVCNSRITTPLWPFLSAADLDTKRPQSASGHDFKFGVDDIHQSNVDKFADKSSQGSPDKANSSLLAPIGSQWSLLVWAGSRYP